MSVSTTKGDFAASAEETVETAATAKPVPFKVDGEEFNAKPFVQGIVLMDFIEASDEGGVKSIVAFKKFLKEALDEEEYTRLDTYLRTSPKEIDVTEISKAIGDLITAYTSRPTNPSAQ